MFSVDDLQVDNKPDETVTASDDGHDAPPTSQVEVANPTGKSMGI